ncbi:hypothetical protein B0I72DRAFT_135594 [Yarrowia lipolytica]|jgi:hypothetical protein|uniref:YALI0B21274p n=2 Tax=Yarrowia lipolytica TaxID=4952 RepID=Q6CDT8_YARLI|nr:YALI0B21274p [Yarrowia lipolytica CLIB122]AOW02020.1 hypothetical protein YALI1_B27685g [Yarrowia lipolytica]KAB8283412.1 hypothetical protein BKA91DRAFT_136679 [Yarrowia lipolytica]KAE8173355.1 hypothetical protein BKA90DRAFT_135954 [Yarrowia lipolytica]KAJ8052788.1 hypothetical protein LXG23DRAFT_38827 [Yarrowia lipolytica]QNP97000.1 Hypothetical protein YALI2_C00653g [Yarrowia lipolytica]|eukprot:XP_501174.1 YALI0B21274p [Yarrowia lipolytica CLIB122]
MRLAIIIILCLTALVSAKSDKFNRELVSLQDFMYGRVPLLGGGDKYVEYRGKSVDFDDSVRILAARRCGIYIDRQEHFSHDNYVGVATLAEFVTQALIAGKCGEANYAYTALCANGDRDTISVKKPKKLMEALKVQLEANRQLTGKRQRFTSDNEELDKIYSKLYTDSLWSWAYIYEWMAFLVTSFYGLVVFL